MAIPAAMAIPNSNAISLPRYLLPRIKIITVLKARKENFQRLFFAKWEEYSSLISASEKASAFRVFGYYEASPATFHFNN